LDLKGFVYPNATLQSKVVPMRLRPTFLLGILLLGGAYWTIAQIPDSFTSGKTWLDPTNWFADWYWYFGPESVGKFGRMKNGTFEETDEQLCVWMANSQADLVNIDPAIHLHAQVTKPASAFPAGPPAFVQVRIQSFYADGSSVSPGVSMRFALVSSDQHCHTYRNVKPILLVDNVNAEGDWPNLVAVAGDDECWTVVLWD
jgi:hypothetical protein